MRYVSGIGNDPRENRKFNMIKQGLDYDKDGQFVRLWVPELGGVKGGRVHFPWTVGGPELAKAGVEIGVTYPGPMVTPPEWARHTGREAGGGGQQRGVDFYFKPQGKQQQGGHGQAKKQQRKPALRGGRVQ